MNLYLFEKIISVIFLAISTLLFWKAHEKTEIPLHGRYVEILQTAVKVPVPNSFTIAVNVFGRITVRSAIDAFPLDRARIKCHVESPKDLIINIKKGSVKIGKETMTLGARTKVLPTTYVYIDKYTWQFIYH